MPGSSEDEDYMSDAFLMADTRPGLLSQQQARDHKMAEKHKKLNEKHKTLPRKQLESQKRTEGLDKALGSDNKGFALLQKMGYKPGMAIGKKGEGRSEPVPLEIKSDRGGLGRDSERKRKAEQIQNFRSLLMQKKRKHEETLREDFRTRMTGKKKEQEVERDLHKSQNVCLQLDSEQGRDMPESPFYWTPALKSGQAEEEEEDEEEKEEEEDVLSSEEKLEQLTAYLRGSYLYCIWCGIRFEDQDDLNANCPGNTAEAHDD